MDQDSTGESPSFSDLSGHDRQIANLVRTAVKKAGNCNLLLASITRTVGFQECHLYSEFDPQEETCCLSDIVGEDNNPVYLSDTNIEQEDGIHELYEFGDREVENDDQDYVTVV